MVKYFFLLIFLLFPAISFAGQNKDEAQLRVDYGTDLRQVPYFLSYDYQQKYHKDWKTTYYTDRKYFLLAYEKSVIADKAKQKAEAKAALNKQRAIAKAKYDEEELHQRRLKADLDKKKQQEKEDMERQKDFNNTIQNQQKELQQMQEQISQEKNSSQR